jgi:hypothetical protein
MVFGLVLLVGTTIAPAQLATDMPTLPEAPMPEQEGPWGKEIEKSNFKERAIIRAERGVLFEEKDIGYGQGRTYVSYNQFELEADKMKIDLVSGNIETEGNVIFRGPNEYIKAKAGRFNLVKAQGVAYGVDGQRGTLYFKAIWNEDEKGPAFRQIDEKMSIFRGTYFTTSAFPVPQYYVTASEVILIRDERVFFRNPVVWVRGVPVFYLPFYTRDLAEGSPWSHEFGYSSKLGAFFRLGYRYKHQTQTPKWEDSSEYRTRSFGLMDTYVDWMSQRGFGVGARYRYDLDNSRHTGYVDVYGVRDHEREIDGEEDSTISRWIYRHKHFSELTRNLSFQMDIDEASDPDIYVDILDGFEPDGMSTKGRLYEQRVRAAVTWHDSNSIARILVDRRERLARDVYTDYSNPFSDDLDFDPDPNFTDGIDWDEDDGIPKNRYATVSENIYARYGTRLLNLGAAPLYYRFEANAFDSLDSGLNSWNTEDDARVRGGDLYGSMTHRMRLGERTTWMNTVGVWSAYYYRDTDDMITQSSLSGGTVQPDGTIKVDDSRFKNQSTVVLGDSTTERDMDRVNDAYLFTDYTSRLNHRFTDFLDGYLKYFIRKGTENSLGEYYESIGRTEASQDIYDFYSDKHYVEAGLNYYLRYPNIRMGLVGRESLERDDDIYANEQIRSITYNVAYENQTGEFSSLMAVGYQERQIRDKDDPNQFNQPTVGGALITSYIPRHARYWGRLVVSGSTKLDDDPVNRDARQRRRFDENETEVKIQPTIGRQFGPKYRVQLSGEFNTKYSTLESFGVTMIRDLADAELGVFVGFTNNPMEDRYDDDDVDDDERDINYDMEIRAMLRLKVNKGEPGLGQRSITTLADLKKEAQFVQ